MNLTIQGKTLIGRDTLIEQSKVLTFITDFY